MVPLLLNGLGFCSRPFDDVSFHVFHMEALWGQQKCLIIERPMSLATHPQASSSKTGTAAHIKLVTWPHCGLKCVLSS